jgi:hypothetical protein
MLVHPMLRARLARVVHLAVPPELLERRLVGSVGRVDGPRVLGEALAELAEEARFEHQYGPERADLVLVADNPLGPAG